MSSACNDEGKDVKSNYSCVSDSMESAEDIALKIKELQKLKRRRKKEEKEAEEAKRRKHNEGELYVLYFPKS